MIRSSVVTLGPDPAALALSEARGFALSAYGSGQTWPVAVSIRDDRGEESALLVREGVWYALGARVVSATAQLPAGAVSASYVLDVGRTREDAALPVAPSGAKAPNIIEYGQRDVTSSDAPGQNLFVAPYAVRFQRPTWARKFSLWGHGSALRSSSGAGAGTAAGQWAIAYPAIAGGATRGFWAVWGKPMQNSLNSVAGETLPVLAHMVTLGGNTATGATYSEQGVIPDEWFLVFYAAANDYGFDSIGGAPQRLRWRWEN